MLTLLLSCVLFGAIQACTQLKTENGFVCVCNSTFCDVIPEIYLTDSSSIQIFYTSATEPGFNMKYASFLAQSPQYPIIEVTGIFEPFQTIMGFGGAFTDATGQNIKRLPEDAQQKLLESYFGFEGIEYSVCRVPIGGTDFSPRAYTLDDHDGDVELQYFELQEEDLNFKIPMIKKAKDLRGSRQLNLFATAWAAPLWMKTTGGFSMLKKEYYQVWADYTVKFFDAYKEKYIDFWGVTTGNEPIVGFYKQNGFNSMGWTTVDQAQWISENLGPTIRNSTHKDVKIMIHDEGGIILPFVVPTLLNDNKVLDVIDGIATHWYYDKQMAPEIKTLLYTDKKDLFLLSTEACHFMTPPLLGSWERAAGYISSIFEYLRYGFGGWVDWNMALNMTGGFSYINNIADAPIIISEDATEFYKQPMFYSLGHFSKFLKPGSYRFGTKQDIPNIQSLAYLRPDNIVTVVIFNSGDNDVDVQIGYFVDYSEKLTIPANSINTVLFRN